MYFSSVLQLYGAAVMRASCCFLQDYVKGGVLQAREATSTLAAASTQCVDAAAAAQRAANAVQDAESALADARRAADAVQVMLQAKQAQGLQSQAEELAAMAQMHANEVHR